MVLVLAGLIGVSAPQKESVERDVPQIGTSDSGDGLANINLIGTKPEFGTMLAKLIGIRNTDQSPEARDYFRIFRYPGPYTSRVNCG
ncbi:MAG: hypothetical protein ABSD31_22010, partial [Candidatus Binataceae bacterium]